MTDDGFIALFRAEHARIVAQLTLWCGDRGVAEELTQDAFARAYRRWGTVRQMDRPGAWVNRVALNLASSKLRRRGAERRANQRATSQTETIHSDPDVARGVAVRDALAELSDVQRTVIVLRFYSDVPPAEIAELLGRSVSAVTSITHRAIERLRALLPDEPIAVPEETAS